MRTMHRVVPATLLVGLVMASPAAAQGGSLKELITGGPAPVTLKLSDLNSTWRRATIVGPDEQKSGDGGGMMGLMGGLMGGMFGGNMASMLTAGHKPPSYTQGNTVTVGTETYLVVYRSDQKPLDIMAIMKLGQGEQLPPPEALKPDSELRMSLVNVRNIQSLNDIRPFVLEQELADSQKAAQAEAALRAEIGKDMGGGLGGLGGLGGGLGGGAEAAITEPDLEEIMEPKPAPAKPARKPAPTKAPARRPTRRR